MDITRININIKHGGFRDVRINEIIEPVMTFFSESFIKEEFAFLRNKGHYSLIMTNKFVEFDTNSPEDVTAIVEVINSINRLSFDFGSLVISLKFDNEIKGTFNHLFKKKLNNIDVEFLGFKFNGDNDKQYKVSLQNTQSKNNTTIKTKLKLKDISNFKESFDILHNEINDQVLPSIAEMMEGD